MILSVVPHLANAHIKRVGQTHSGPGKKKNKKKEEYFFGYFHTFFLKMEQSSQQRY
jgi:hypothetical protein